MSIRDDFFAAQAKASLWDVAVSIKRGNPLPLDANSVFKAYGTVGGEDYAGSLLEYATSNPVAYPGQICAVVGVDATTIYYLDQELAIKPVGIIPTGDGKSIDVTPDGEISLHGFESLTESNVGYLPRVKKVIDVAAAEGIEEVYHLEIEWAPVSAIVEGDGNSVTEVAAGCPCINVEDKADADFEGHQYEVSLNISANAGNILEEKEDGLYASVHIPEYAVKADERAEGATETKYHLTKDGVNTGDEIIVPDAYNDEALAGRIGALETKVDTGDKNVSAYVAEKIADAEIGKLTKVIADSVTEDGKVVIGGETTDPAEHVIYMVKVETATGDMYKEYQVIGGELVQTGDTSTDLSGYVTKTTKINGKALEGDVELKADDILVSGAGDAGSAFGDMSVQEALGQLKTSVDTANSRKADEIGIDEESVGSIKDALVALKNTTINGKPFASSLGSANVWDASQAGEIILTGENIKTSNKSDTVTITKAIEDVNQAVTDLEAAAEEAYAKKATTLAGYGITDAYTKDEVDAKIGIPGVPELKDSEGTVTQQKVDGTGIFASTYSKAEINALLDEVEGGSTESAASVARQLDDYKTSNNERVAKIEEQVGHDVNGETPATGLFLEVDEARKQADKGVNDAYVANQAVTQLAQTTVAANATAIENLQALVGAISDKGTDTLAGKIGALEAHDEAHAIEFGTLSGKVDQNTLDIAKKANASDVYTKGETEALLVPYALAENVYTKDAANALINVKANAADVYTKDEVNAELVKKLDATVIADYLKSADAANTYATIAALEAEAKRADEAEKANAKAIADLTAGAVKDNADAIAEINALLNTISDTDDITSLKELALWVEEHESEVLPVIEKNSTDIAALTTRVAANETAVGTTLPAAIAAAEAAAKKYTDDNMVKADGVSIENTDGTFSVKAVSTDVLTNGTKTLILNGGSATV